MGCELKQLIELRDRRSLSRRRIERIEEEPEHRTLAEEGHGRGRRPLFTGAGVERRLHLMRERTHRVVVDPDGRDLPSMSPLCREAIGEGLQRVRRRA